MSVVCFVVFCREKMKSSHTPKQTKKRLDVSNISSSSAAAAAVLPELTRPEGGRYLPVERIFVPFELACGATKSPRLVASALDSIQKLVAYGHIKYSDVKT